MNLDINLSLLDSFILTQTFSSLLYVDKADENKWINCNNQSFVFCRHNAYFGLLFETKRSSSKDYKTSGQDLPTPMIDVTQHDFFSYLYDTKPMKSQTTWILKTAHFFNTARIPFKTYHLLRWCQTNEDSNYINFQDSTLLQHSKNSFQDLPPT